jgi:hypothetical protein
MNLIELKWNGFLHPFAFKFERHKKRWEEGLKIHIRPTRNLGKGGKCEKKEGKDEGDALNL